MACPNNTKKRLLFEEVLSLVAKTVSVVKDILCIVLHAREHVRLFDEVSQFYRQIDRVTLSAF